MSFSLSGVPLHFPCGFQNKAQFVRNTSNAWRSVAPLRWYTVSNKLKTFMQQRGVKCRTWSENTQRVSYVEHVAELTVQNVLHVSQVPFSMQQSSSPMDLTHHNHACHWISLANDTMTNSNCGSFNTHLQLTLMYYST